MIKTYQILIQELSNYKNPKTKIQRMAENCEIYPIAKGLYETNKNVEPFFLADALYSPSYISFETALSYYGLIPERVYTIKSATFRKMKRKEYKTYFGRYTYQDVPENAFPYGTNIYCVEGYTYRLATKEKALLDQLYSASPINNMKEMKEYLFDNLRINEIILKQFDLNLVNELADLYHSKNVTLFNKMLKGGKLHD